MRAQSLFFVALGILASGLGISTVQAADAPAPPQINWSFNQVWGTFNRAELQRGFQVYKQVCSVCHSLKYLRYEKLAALGFSEAEIKAIAADYEVAGPLDEDGVATIRKAIPADFFAKPYPNDNAARAANNGSFPPDLTLMVKARKYGADYLYSILTGYVNPPADFKLMEGLHYNKYFPGHQIAMPAPFNPGQLEYADGTAATIEQMAHDVTVFLAWAAEPEAEQRKQLGLKVIIYLSVFTALMYTVMRRTWRRVKNT